jgi:hypothetical protein
MFNGLYVNQEGNQYGIWTPQRIQIAVIAMPPDGQYMRDAKAIYGITKVLAPIWGLTPDKKN